MKKSVLLIFIIALSVNYLKAQEEKYIGLYVYSFTKYFNWPESSKSGDFIIEVIGHSSVYDELCKITSGKKVGNQNIRIRQIATPEQVSNCHILFLGHWQSRYLKNIRQKITGKPVLLIAEYKGLANKGAGINFVLREGTIKFQLNLINTKNVGLETDMRIKQLACDVIE